MEVDDDGKQLPYADKYTVRDYDGRCLSPSTDEYFGNAKVIVTPCTGRTEQKWNADPNISASSVVRLTEITGGDAAG